MESDTFSIVRALGWHNGGAPADAAGYGLKFLERDRDRYFHTDWTDVVIELDDGEAATISLSPSFWRGCSELRSAKIGRWLLASSAAPWHRGTPPSIAVEPLEDNRFSARLLKRHNLL